MLDGDLVLKGYGDPKLTLEHFWLLLRALRARGLREIRGDLVLDRSYFEPGEHDPAQFDAEPLRAYNVGPDALLLNFKAVRFQFVPERGYEERDRHRRTAAGRTRVRRRGARHRRRLRRLARGHQGRFSEQRRIGAKASFIGNMPASCGERYWNLAPADAAAITCTACSGSCGRSWAARCAAACATASCPPDARLLVATYESPSAAEVVRDINKFSNNVMARQVFLTLSRRRRSSCPGRYDRSTRAVQLLARGTRGSTCPSSSSTTVRAVAHRAHQRRRTSAGCCSPRGAARA